MTTLKDIIANVESSIKEVENDCEGFPDGMNSASWGYQEGVLISANDAQKLLNRINKLSNLPSRTDFS